MISKTIVRTGVLMLGLSLTHLEVQATEMPAVNWSGRVTVEKDNGDFVDTAPFVKVGELLLSRFSQMQNVTFQETVSAPTEGGSDVLYVFRVWQGGASQGEQLMLVTLGQSGMDIIGPYATDFETLKIKPATGDAGPVFELFGADAGKPLATLEYFSGQLIALN